MFGESYWRSEPVGGLNIKQNDIFRLATLLYSQWRDRFFFGVDNRISTPQDKLIFILYQMKLVLLRKDFVRCQILSRKISKRHLGEAGLEALKIQYYLYMV